MNFKKQKKLASFLIGFLGVFLCSSSTVLASSIIPIGKDNALLYYKMGGDGNYALPPINDNQTIDLGTQVDLSAGKTCGAFNPLLSITNTFNDLQNSADNLAQGILKNATGSLGELPMYFLAQANPTAYNMINNTLMRAHQLIEISTKSCQEVKHEISQGKNPYQDWATISVGNSWKKHLSLTAQGEEDINHAKKEIDEHAGDDGVPWVKGMPADSGFLAGGKNQPPIHVIADTVEAGYNALLLRELDDTSPAPLNNELSRQFPSPIHASHWIANVVGDQIITTCTDKTCEKNQGGISGRGLLPWITTCSNDNQTFCAEAIRQHLSNLVSGNLPLTSENIALVSANGLVISPEAIAAIRHKDATQQALLISKLSQEISTQKVMNKALIARNLLQTGAQIPVIASHQPAQKILMKAIHRLDKDIQSLAFEFQMRKQMTSETLSEILSSQQHQQSQSIEMSAVTDSPPLMRNSAVENDKLKRKLS